MDAWRYLKRPWLDVTPRCCSLLRWNICVDIFYLLLFTIDTLFVLQLVNSENLHRFAESLRLTSFRKWVVGLVMCGGQSLSHWKYWILWDVHACTNHKGTCASYHLGSTKTNESRVDMLDISYVRRSLEVSVDAAVGC